MYPYGSEDVAWQRLIDTQREMENSRIWANRGAGLFTRVGRALVRAAQLTSMAVRRTPLTQAESGGGEAASAEDAA